MVATAQRIVKKDKAENMDVTLRQCEVVREEHRHNQTSYNVVVILGKIVSKRSEVKVTF